MPRKGYRAITIPEKLAKQLRERAKQANTSIPRQIEELLNQSKKEAR